MMKCPLCDSKLQLVDDRDLWLAYICEVCYLIILQLKYRIDQPNR